MSRLALVLHGHLPWVLHHGRWPHGEDWLFEAASETWLPLLGVLERCAAEGLRPGWSLGLTPPLLEQLAHPTFRAGFPRWLAEAREQADGDARDFNAWGQGALSWNATRVRDHLAEQEAQLAALGGDLIGALRRHAAAGRIGFLGSAATHASLPLLLHDRSVRAQIRAGRATTERHLGHRPAAFWLPECAYRPPGSWQPPAVHPGPRYRAGLGALLAEEGVTAVVVDHQLIAHAVPVAAREGGRLLPGTGPRGWREVLEPHEIAEGGEATGVRAVARCFDLAERVWNADRGYPGDPRYLEFHRRHGRHGLRYWRVTGRQVGLGDKAPWEAEGAEAAVRAHAEDFVRGVEERLGRHRAVTGRPGLLCTPFDAELFGHWWHEGPGFLLEVARLLHGREDVTALPLAEALEHAPPDKVAALPEGTWGAGGDHQVWVQEETAFVWDRVYRAEDRFLGLLDRPAARRDPAARSLLEEAARQLLLLQASDWPFVVATGGAPDYGTRRVHGHAARFDDLCLGVEDHLAGRPPGPLPAATVAWCRVADPLFPDLDLDWWT